MAEKRMYIVMVRGKGMFLVEPAKGKDRQSVIEQALGLTGGYSAGEIDTDLPEDATEAWAAWVEGESANGQPYFLFRAFDGALSEEAILAVLADAKEEPLKLNKTEVHRAPS